MLTARNALFALFLTACATTPAPTPAPTPSPTQSAAPQAAAEPAAPWNANARAAAPQVMLDEWQKAENRATCAPLTITDFGDRARDAKPRRANFGGGWAVAWDQPGLPGRGPTGSHCDTCGRGVFGIAGAGITVGEDEDNVGFPYRNNYAGSNWAGYALEGGTGPNWLAQVRVDDQQCVYQVWSFLGRSHLEHLIRHLRRVAR